MTSELFSLRNYIYGLGLTNKNKMSLFQILFKMDNNGGGVLVENEKLCTAMNMPRDKFTFDKFMNMCILSGCDYLPSLHGIGLAKACKFFTVTSNPDIHNVNIEVLDMFESLIDVM